MIYWKTFWMEEVFDFSVRGKQNMGARNLVRQALLDKRLFIAKALCPLRNMVRLAGVGHEVPAPASATKSVIILTTPILNVCLRLPKRSLVTRQEFDLILRMNYGMIDG